MDYPSHENYLAPLYGSNASSNGFGYENETVDAKIAEGNRAGSIEAGIAAYNQAEDQVLRDMPNAPLWFGKSQGVHSENVSNVIIDPFTRVRVDQVTVNQ